MDDNPIDDFLGQSKFFAIDHAQTKDVNLIKIEKVKISYGRNDGEAKEVLRYHLEEEGDLKYFDRGSKQLARQMYPFQEALRRNKKIRIRISRHGFKNETTYKVEAISEETK